MDPELKTACVKAAAKTGIGLSLLMALIGIRMLTAVPAGVASGIAELERLEAESTIESEGSELAEDAAEADSIVAGLGDGLRDRLSDSKPAPRTGDELVSCRLAGRVQFMRAHACAQRGGQSTLVETKKR